MNKAGQMNAGIEFLRIKDRYEVMEWLSQRYDEGFRYVVRDDFGDTWLTAYSIKPKKYMDDGCWGYRERDFNDIQSMPAKIIKNTDMPEINWHNKSAMNLEKLLGIGGK